MGTVRWTLLLGVLTAARGARAEAPEDDPGRFRVGVNVTLVGLPRPIEVEGYARLHPVLALSGAWSTFPKFLATPLLDAAGANSDTTHAELGDFSAWEVALRLFPTRGIFFVGVGVGRQNLEGTVAGTENGVTGAGTVKVESWVVTPRIGWQWVWSSGLALGLDLGVQVTAAHTDTLTVPPGTPPDVVRDAKDLVNFGANVPLPSIRLRLGYHVG